MGAWDTSVFGNDDAADFLYEFDDARTVAQVVPLLEDALDAALDASPEIEATDGSVGLAAAALVACWGEPTLLRNEAGEDMSPWPRTAEPLPGRLQAKAARVLERMHDSRGNELGRLWAESGKSSEFEAELRRWRSRLP
jgi:Domain of unknown function (DUF4259)